MAIVTEKNLPQGSFSNHLKYTWWFKPLLQGLVIIIFVAYTTATLFFSSVFGDGKFGNYRSPIFDIDVPQSVLNALHWPANNPFLPTALLVLWVPIGYRATCYYMRRIYYRSFFGNPPACATNGVDFRRGKYTGERFLPFILNNYHRYFLYAAIVVALIHWIELPNAFNMGTSSHYQFGIGVGTIIIALDTLLLTFYVLSCHAFRHLFGGGSNCYSCSSLKTAEHKTWKVISVLNEYHGTFFWLSLISVMVADFYIRLLVPGNVFGFTIHDYVFFRL